MHKFKSEAFEALPAERNLPILPEKRVPAFAQVTLEQEPKSDSCTVKLHVRGILLEIQNAADSQTVDKPFVLS